MSIEKKKKRATGKRNRPNKAKTSADSSLWHSIGLVVVFTVVLGFVAAFWLQPSPRPPPPPPPPQRPSSSRQSAATSRGDDVPRRNKRPEKSWQEYMELGKAACMSDDVDGCSSAYATALRLAPKELGPHLIMFEHNIELEIGTAAYNAKRLAEAVEHLLRSVELGEPGGGSTLRATFTLGQALEARAQVVGGGWSDNEYVTQALEAYEAVVASDGFVKLDDLELRVNCLTNLGYVHHKRDSLEASARFLRAAVGLQPDHYIATKTLIETLIWDGDQEGADALAKRAVERGMWERYDQTPVTFTHGISTQPWPDLTQYPQVAAAIASLEANYEAIRAECLAMMGRSGGEGLNSGQMEGMDGRAGGWHARKLDCSGTGDPQAPQTCSAVRSARRTTDVYTSQFLRLEPGAVIRPHCGTGNNRWVVHLGLDGLEGAEITVAGEPRGWKLGRCIVFDDSYRHSVKHSGAAERLVLALQIENPVHAKMVKR